MPSMYRTQRRPEYLYFLLLGGACSVYDETALRSSAQSRPAEIAEVAGAAAVQATVAPEPPISQPEGKSCADSGDLTSYCSQLPRLPLAPVIDGEAECGLPLLAIGPESWNGSAPAPSLRVAYAAAWRDEGLYMHVEVRGREPRSHAPEQPIFCGDAVELYVDGNAARAADTGTYQAAGTAQFVIAAPAAPGAAIDAWRFVQGNPQGAWITRDLHVNTLDDGYSVEALISARDLGLWSWSPASQLGFDVAIDVAQSAGDAQACERRLGQYLLRVQASDDDCRGQPWCDVRAFCRPQLSSP